MAFGDEYIKGLGISDAEAMRRRRLQVPPLPPLEPLPTPWPPQIETASIAEPFQTAMMKNKNEFPMLGGGGGGGYSGGRGQAPQQIEDLFSSHARGEITNQQLQKSLKDQGWSVDLRQGRGQRLQGYDAYDPGGHNYFIDKINQEAPLPQNLDQPRYASTAKWLRDLSPEQDPIGAMIDYENMLQSVTPITRYAGTAMQGLPAEGFRPSENVSEVSSVPPLPRVDYGHQATDLAYGDIPYNAPLLNALLQRHPGEGVYPIDAQMKQDIELSRFADLFKKRAQGR